MVCSHRSSFESPVFQRPVHELLQGLLCRANTFVDKCTALPLHYHVLLLLSCSIQFLENLSIAVVSHSIAANMKPCELLMQDSSR